MSALAKCLQGQGLPASLLSNRSRVHRLTNPASSADAYGFVSQHTRMPFWQETNVKNRTLFS